jgi:mannobiose 2-epimerase
VTGVAVSLAAPSKSRGAPARRHAIAQTLAADLRQRVMPYWYDTAVDTVNGGYHLSDSHRAALPPLVAARARASRLLQHLGLRRAPDPGKHLVSQSRMLYAFSLAHRKGLGGGARSYADAAAAGYRFLVGPMHDEAHGGFYWRVDDSGRRIDTRKFLYGQAFAIYALVEYHRACGRREPLEHALSLFRTISDTLHDGRNGGWVEHAGADFRAIDSGAATRDPWTIDVVGAKSCNAHLHLMEALSELLDVCGDDHVRAALEELVEITTSVFFPAAGKFRSYVSPSLQPLPGFDEFCFGHNVEFAWLLLRAQQALGRVQSWDRFQAILEHAVVYGFDQSRGGFFNKGKGGAGPSDTTKVWWAQAEGLAALTVAVQSCSSTRFEESLDLLLTWIMKHQRLPDGIWVAATDRRGRVKSATKASSWKAAYHEVRAITMFVEAFAGSL